MPALPPLAALARVFFLPSLLAWQALAGHAAPLPTEQMRALDATVQQALQARQAPGAVVLIAREGERLFERAYGLADAASGRPMRLDTAFEVGSLTKQMTAAAVMRLVQQGRLTLDDPVRRFVPEYAAAAGVTVRQLLQQTSGLPDFAGTDAFAARATQQAARFDDVLATVKGRPPGFAPGSRFQYSNTNYLLLARIVEQVTGQPFDRWLADNVLAPAGLRHTAARDGALQWPSLATGHQTEAGRVGAAPRFEPSWIRGAGEMIATADDLLAWAQALRGGRALGTGTWAAMTAPTRLNDGRSQGYGFGLLVDRQGGQPRVWHGGGTLGTSSSLMLYPDEGLVIVVLVNHEALNASALSAALYEVLHPEARAAHAPVAGEDPAQRQRAQGWLVALQKGTPAAGIALAAADRARLQASLDVYGRAEDFVWRGTDAALRTQRYAVRFGAQWFVLSLTLGEAGALVAADLQPE